METRAPYQPNPRALKSWIESFVDHTESPRLADFDSSAGLMMAELKFAEARGLAIGLVEAGYVEVPSTYSVHEALDTAYRKVSAVVEELDRAARECDQEGLEDARQALRDGYEKVTGRKLP